jgi:hypothetical protein
MRAAQAIAMSPLVPGGVFGVQAALMLVDEFHFHRRRLLPRWECIGHPLDTLSVFVCYTMTIALAPSSAARIAYGAAAVFSCLFVTKDEFVHAKLCGPGEHWLHSVLFVAHPIVLGVAAWLWIRGEHRTLLLAQGSITLVFGFYQTVYWNRPWQRPSLQQ